MTDDDLLKEALDSFDECQEAESENREIALDDLRFSRLGEQWPDNVKRQREIEGRPALTFNRMPTFIRQVVNDARMNRPAIKVHPVDSGADVQTADVLNGLIRNIEQSSNADVAYDTAIDNAVSCGVGYFRINTEYACEDTFDLDLKIERISNPFSVYGDPSSTAADSSDWNRAFVTDWLTEDEFKESWPDAEKTSFDAGSDDRDNDWFVDKSVRIAEYWRRDKTQARILQLSNGSIMYENEYLQIKDVCDIQNIVVVGERMTHTYEVKQCVMSGSEVLEHNKWLGKYIPIVPVYGDEVFVEGKRYWRSLIHFAKDAQQAYNYWRTSSIEKVALDTKAPWIGPRGAFKTDLEKWATANTRNHPFIEFDGGVPPMRTPAGGVPAGDIQMALSASDDMKSIMGIYDASLGSRSNETSGRAILARQREGDVSTFHFIDNMARGIRHAGRILIDMIPMVYNTPRILRTLGEDGSPGMIPVNQETIIQGIPKVFDLTAGKYDVTVSSGPAFSTRREESANQMLEMMRAYPPVAPVIGDLVAKNLDWPGADEIAKRLKATLPPELQGENPQVKQLQQQLAEQGQIIEAGKTMLGEMQLKLADKSTSNAIDAEKLKIDAFKAETDRMEAEAKIMGERIKAQQTALAGVPVGGQVPQLPPIDLSQIMTAIMQVRDQIQGMMPAKEIETE